MLSALHIENMALIRSLDITFHDGFTAMTGETGAGKSILIDSIGLLIGRKADRSMVRTGETSATVRGVFSSLSEHTVSLLRLLDIFPDDDGNLIVERTIFSDGKGRAKVNGTPVTTTLLRSAAPMLITIHGQSDTLALSEEGNYIRLLDAFAKNEELLVGYAEAYSAYEKLRRERDEIAGNESERIRTAEMLRYQIADIDAVKPKEREDILLEEKEKKLKSRERISRQTNFAYRILKSAEKGNAVLILDKAVTALETITDVYPELTELCQRLTECRYQIDDIAEIVYDMVDHDESDPTSEIDRIESRLDAISKLRKKYGAEISDILSYREKAAARLSALEHADERLADVEVELEEAYRCAASLAHDLHEKRVEASVRLASAMKETLTFLDMPRVEFMISVEELFSDGKCILGANGADRVDFLISANKGESMQSLALVASGGELSRIMLSLKSVSAMTDDTPTMIFDEIDAGVSGRTARKIGMKLLDLSHTSQVFCVTHSAQIASLSDDHLLISKHEEGDRTVTQVTRLDEAGRIAELSRVLGGIRITDAQRRAAEDMRAEKAALDSSCKNAQ